MSDIRGDERMRGKPLTMRRKHPIIQSPASLNNLSDDVLIQLMCSLDIDTILKVSSINKRVNAIFRSPWFFRQCVAPKLSIKQRRAAIVSGHKLYIRHDYDELYAMYAEGITIDGVEYKVDWSMDPHAYADNMNIDYENEGSMDYGKPPEDVRERSMWFRAHYDGDENILKGVAEFTFPQGMNGVGFVRERVEDVLTYFTQKFMDFLKGSNVDLRDGQDFWQIKVGIRPFGMQIDVSSVDWESVIEEVVEAMDKKHKSKVKKVITPKEGPSAYFTAHIGFAVGELERTLVQVETNPRESDDRKLKDMCETYVEEARELLEKVRLGEANDESTIDHLNKINTRLLECIES